jgi:hypothetical protein
MAERAKCERVAYTLVNAKTAYVVALSAIILAIYAK